MNSPVNHPDQKYIAALVQGDSQLVEEIYQRFAGGITAMVLKNNGSEADSADILQEALLAIYKKAQTGDFQLSCPFEAFLYTVCRNKWLMELRKRKHQPVTFTEELKYEIDEGSLEAAERLAQYSDRKKLLKAKLEELNEGCRRLLSLCWAGKPLQEIAVQMETSYGYIRRKKGECLGRLVKLMKESSSFNHLKH